MCTHDNTPRVSYNITLVRVKLNTQMCNFTEYTLVI